MATSLVECTLAQVFKRRQPDGSFRGGPANSIIYGLGKSYRWLAVLYSVCLVAVFGFGINAFQGNTVAGAIHASVEIPRLVSGSVLALITGVIVFGGLQRIAKATNIIVPVMAISYLLMALVVIGLNIEQVSDAFYMIFANAFGLEEATAGGVGAAISQGMRRGLFSNEAGLGSVPNVAATAEVSHPVSMGITQAFSVFIDTFIICTCTALIILLSGVYQPDANIDGVVLTQSALTAQLGDWAQYALSCMVLLFSFSTIIYNYYLGENAVAFITQSHTNKTSTKRHESRQKVIINTFRILVIAVVFLGATAPNATAVFFFSDPLMGILAIVNLLALMMLLPVCMRVLKDYRQQQTVGIKTPVFDATKFADLHIDKTAWQEEARLHNDNPSTARATPAKTLKAVVNNKEGVSENA